MLPIKPKFSSTTPNVPVVLDRRNPLARGVVGAWIFDAPKANVSRDYSGNGKHGDWVNTSSKLSKSASKYGLNFRHEGGANNNRINLGSTGTTTPVALTGSNQFTIIVKTFRDSSLTEGSFPRIIDRSDGGNAANGWGIWFTTAGTDKTVFASNNGGLTAIETVNLTVKDVWETWAIRSDGDINTAANTQWFKDGLPVVTTYSNTSSASTLSTSTVDMAIGNWNHSTDRAWNGEIDFVYIYDRPLSDAEIQSIHNNPYQIFKPAVEQVLFKPSAGGATHALLADDVESASEVTSPSIGQVHALTSTDTEAASEVTSPAVGQAHAILADDTQSASEVSAPAIGQAHALVSVDIESASSVAIPAIGQAHVLVSVDVESASEVTAPTIDDTSSVDALLANDVSSTSEVTSPSVGQSHGLTAVSISSASEVTTPAVGQAHILLATDIQAASEAATVTVGQIHILTADDVEAASNVTNPTLSSFAGAGSTGRVAVAANSGNTGSLTNQQGAGRVVSVW